MASFKVISEKDFNTYQTAWLEAVAAGDKISSLFRLADGSWLYGYTIGQDLVRELISKVGIKKVMVSFGVDTSTTPNVFTLVLYGKDNSNNVVSSYYQILIDGGNGNDGAIKTPFDKGIPVSDPSSSVLYPDYVPYALVEQWTSIYTGVITQAFMIPPIPIPASLFKVWYVKDQDNRLKSYSFDINTFKEAIYRAMTNDNSEQDNASANFYFAIRKGDPASVLDEQNIFSLILQWMDIIKDSHGNNTQLYYYFDLTVPCPPCCPSCP